MLDLNTELNMRRINQALLICVSTIFLISCGGSGGTLGGLIPLPKVLKGEVKGGTYFSPNNIFKVRLPHPPAKSHEDEYEWKYTKVREVGDGTVIGVVFGTAAFDLNLYHAVLIRKPLTLKKDKKERVEQLFARKVSSRNDKLKRIAYKEFDLNGKPCFYAAYESKNSYLVLSLVDNANNFYVVESDVYKKSAIKPRRFHLVDREWKIFNSMLESFTVN